MRPLPLLAALLVLVLPACGEASPPDVVGGPPELAGAPGGTTAAPPPAAGQAVAIFASGCFWCVEHDLEHLPGVVSATSGYTGGRVANPSYEQVSHEDTGHVEAVRLVFDPKKTTYEALLTAYWKTVDPFDGDGQFCDQGPSYRPVIFVADAAQRAAAEKSRAAVQDRLGRPVLVEIRDASTFWVAEAYHQDYAAKNSWKYSYYRWACGRDARLAEVWGAR